MIKDNKRAPRQILHTSDAQLEWLGGGGCRGLEAIVNVAIETKVDLVIIAGDLFEHNRIDDEVIGFAVEQLQRLPVCAIILPGNHDCLVPGSVYDRWELWEGAANTRIFRAAEGETMTFPSLGISVWGKAIESHDGDFRPLEGMPRPEKDGLWHIAVAHGYYIGDAPPIFPSFHISDEEIINSGQDYIALGHWPVFRCVCDEPVKAYYCDPPGNTVNIVSFDEETGVQITRYPTVPNL